MLFRSLLLCAILAASIALLYLIVIRTGSSPEETMPSGLFGPLLVASMLGGLVYTALFATLGTFLKHPMIVGLGYTFAIEGFLAGLPGKSQALTIQYYVRSYLLAEGSPLWRTPASGGSGEEGGLFAMAASTAGASDAVVALGVILAVALAIGVVTISRKQYVLPA